MPESGKMTSGTWKVLLLWQDQRVWVFGVCTYP